MEYLALYRKYRSQTFEEIAGQQHIVRTLQNALTNNRIAHAYLFTGPRGTGKTSMARLFAKALNCDKKMGSICNECENCHLISAGSHPDVIEIDAASNSRVEEIRNLIERVKYAPIKGQYKIYIIDEVHMLSNSAFNALLKTLEEPPANVVFILATTEPHKVLPTIVSRCQRFDFTKLNDKDLKKHLLYVCEKEAIEIEEEGLKEIINLSDGGARDALSILDQLQSYCGNYISYLDVLKVFGLVSKDEIFDFVINILNKNTNIVINKLNDYLDFGIDLKKLNNNIVLCLKDVLLYKTTKNPAILQYLTIDKAQELSNVAKIDQINSLIECFIDCSNQFKFVANVKNFYEIFILKISAKNIVEQQVMLEDAPLIKPVITQEEKNDTDNSIIKEKIVNEEDEKTAKPQHFEQNLKKEETVPYKESREAQSIDPSLLVGYDDNFIMRAIVKSTKDLKQQLFSKWPKLNELLINAKYAKFIPMLKNSTLFSFCNEFLIIQTQFNGIINTINNKENSEVVSEIIEIIWGNKIKVYAINYSEAQRLLLKYYNLKQLNRLPVVKQEESIFDV